MKSRNIAPQTDRALRSCSLAARGLWCELLGVMRAADPVGTITRNRQPINLKTLAQIAGCSSAECARCLKELETAGVLERDGDMLFCPSIAREEQIRQVRREAGKKGGNPVLLGTTKDIGQVKPDVIQTEKLPENHPSTSRYERDGDRAVELQVQSEPATAERHALSTDRPDQLPPANVERPIEVPRRLDGSLDIDRVKDRLEQIRHRPSLIDNWSGKGGV